VQVFSLFKKAASRFDPGLGIGIFRQHEETAELGIPVG
jgi:hypothetical protein